MPSASFNKFNQFVEDIGKGVHNLAAAGDTLKLLLVNSPAPVATNSVKADLTEIAAGNGYSAGGPTLANQSFSQTAGVATFDGDNLSVSASGGSIGPFRYAVLYNDTPTSPADPLIAWWDYGSAVTLNDGETFNFNITTNLCTIT